MQQTILIILAIFIVGYFIVRAIRSNTQTNATIALNKIQQEDEQKLENDEKKNAILRKKDDAQLYVSMSYLEHIRSILMYKIILTQARINYINPPSEYTTNWNYKTGNWMGFDKEDKLTNKVAIKKAIKLEIESTKDTIIHWNNKWNESMKDDTFGGYVPEDLELIRKKYNPETWDIYIRDTNKLTSLESQLKGLTK